MATVDGAAGVGFAGSATATTGTAVAVGPTVLSRRAIALNTSSGTFAFDIAARSVGKKPKLTFSAEAMVRTTGSAATPRCHLVVITSIVRRESRGHALVRLR